jgi:hypothetical protein
VVQDVVQCVLQEREIRDRSVADHLALFRLSFRQLCWERKLSTWSANKIIVAALLELVMALTDKVRPQGWLKLHETVSTKEQALWKYLR